QFPRFSLISQKSHLRLPAQAIADATYGLKQPGVCRILFQFLAQPADMDIDGTRITRIVIAPDMLEDLIASQDRATIANEIDEKVKELGCSSTTCSRIRTRRPARSIRRGPTVSSRTVGEASRTTSCSAGRSSRGEG